MELSKKDKKIAAQLIELGVTREFENGLNKVDEVLKEWKDKKRNNRDSYHLLFKTIKDFDKHIALRYDGRTGSHFFSIVVGLFIDDIIEEKELEGFSEEVRQRILFLKDNL